MVDAISKFLSFILFLQYGSSEPLEGSHVLITVKVEGYRRCYYVINYANQGTQRGLVEYMS